MQCVGMGSYYDSAFGETCYDGNDNLNDELSLWPQWDVSIRNLWGWVCLGYGWRGRGL